MSSLLRFLCLCFLVASSTAEFSALAQNGRLTAELEGGVIPPTGLVRHENPWRYSKGTNSPQADWKTAADTALGSAWLTGPGGLGYGDIDDTTGVEDMRYTYTTLYLRQTFTVTNGFNSNQRLQLRIDYDDAFIAWLDGVEIARSTNAPGQVGVEPSHTATAAQAHEASGGGAGASPPEIIDLGPAADRLGPGTHVLAIMVMNDDIGSSDLTLIADLEATTNPGNTALTGYYTAVRTNTVMLTGSNTWAGSTRVVVNAMDATYNPGTGAWSHLLNLEPGMNSVFVAALDAEGKILASLTRNILVETRTISVGGALTMDTVWESSLGIFRLTNNVLIPNGLSLTINSGAVVLLSPGVSIQVSAGATLKANGSAEQPVYFLPASGSNAWSNLHISGTAATLDLRHVELAAGSVTINNQAEALIEDSFLHDRPSLITANQAKQVTLRRVRVSNYDETIFNSGTRVLVEDSLFENLRTPSSDALEIQGGPAGSAIRYCTFRRSVGSNSDAVDFNGTSGTRVENCLIHDFTDKGISLGAAGAGGATDHGIVISNCLIYRVDTGVAVKDGSTVELMQTTIAQAAYGLRLYEKFSPMGGGRITNGFNNILWNITNAVEVSNGGTLAISHSILQGTNWPGEQNLNADPRFVNPVAGNFTLGAGSPASGSGLDGLDRGVLFPIGGIPSSPVNLAAHAFGTNQIHLWWQEDADNEAGFVIERSLNKIVWATAGQTGPNVTNWTDDNTVVGQLYFYRVSAANHAGVSGWANLASAKREPIKTVVGGTLTVDTRWSPELGHVYVRTNILVPTNVTLRIAAGTVVELTNRASILAQAGGRILIEGTSTQQVVFKNWNGTNHWGELRAEGHGAMLVIRHADISGGQTTVYNNAEALFEDTYFHDFFQQSTPTTFNQPIVLSQFARATVVRRCYFKNYYESLWRNGVITIEDSLFENMVGDAMDYDGVHPGSVVRRCTFRHGNRGNVDAIDIGNDGANLALGVTVESCLMYDFPFDKGVSIGEGARDILVTNCLIYACNWGIGVKDSSYAALFNNTITACDTGFRVYEKIAGQGSGFVTNAENNILWGNTNSVGVFNGGMLVMDYSDAQGTNWPGTGNFISDPLFINPAGRDYRVAATSPCRGAGRDGTDLGARLPVGSPLAPSNPTLEFAPQNEQSLKLRFWADSERTYSLQVAEAVNGPWTNVAVVPAPVLPRLVEFTRSATTGTRFYRLVTPAQP